MSSAAMWNGSFSQPVDLLPPRRASTGTTSTRAPELPLEWWSASTQFVRAKLDQLKTKSNAVPPPATFIADIEDSHSLRKLELPPMSTTYTVYFPRMNYDTIE